MSTLKDRIQEDIKDAMRSGDKPRLASLRLLHAAIKQTEIDCQKDGERPSLNDTAVIQVIIKMLKQRRDSIEQFTTAGRTDLVEKEAYEISVLTAYMPAQLSEAEVEAEISAAVKESGATSMKDMGKVMAILKPKLEGRTDLTAVSALIKKALQA